MKNRLFKVISFLTVFSATLALSNCATGAKRFPSSGGSVDLAGKSVLVVAYDNALKDSVAEKGFAAAVANEAGSLKVLPTIPEGIRGASKTFAGFGLNNSGNVNSSDPKIAVIDEILMLARAIGGNFDYILFASIEEGGSSILMPSLSKARYLGSVYDISTRKVVAAVETMGPLPGKGNTGVVAASGRSMVKILLGKS